MFLSFSALDNEKNKDDRGGGQDLDGYILGAYMCKKRKEKQQKDSKWTIEYVVAKAGVDDKHLGYVERGASSQPSFVYICKLADALEIKPDRIRQELKQKTEAFLIMTSFEDFSLSLLSYHSEFSFLL